jgi:hypothetical protein
MMKNMTIPESVICSSLAPIKTVCVKNGFALGPAGSFFKSARPLRIEIEGLRLLSPAQIQDLLQNRTNLEEIKMLIEEEADPSYIYRGKIRIENDYYSLVNLNFRCRESGTVLRANLADDLADLREDDGDRSYAGNNDDIIGQIETRECDGISKGNLVISQGTLSGRYTVHLDAHDGDAHDGF